MFGTGTCTLCPPYGSAPGRSHHSISHSRKPYAARTLHGSILHRTGSIGHRSFTLRGDRFSRVFGPAANEWLIVTSFITISPFIQEIERWKTNSQTDARPDNLPPAPMGGESRKREAVAVCMWRLDIITCETISTLRQQMPYHTNVIRVLETLR